MNKLLEAVTRFFATVTSNGISLAGSALTTVAAFLFVLLFSIHLVSETGGSPYLGILTFLVLPALFLIGLALIPVGLWRLRKRRRQAMAEDDPAAEFAVLDFNQPQTRRTALVFVAATAINALILGVGTYKGVEVMESTEFCGAACHTVMQPEYTTYKRSPHARVKCVECHIGAGANWFVKSKLSGSWQVVSVAFDLYPRPIPVPVHNLRPARETCEECHWPNKFVGDRFKVNTHFSEDEANTETKTVLVVKVGGRQAGLSQGIHWHVDPDHTLRYRSDEKRQTMYEVEMVTRDGTRKSWTGPAASTPEGQRATEWRTMDCIDCHNRPTHIYRSPEGELDAALLDRRIDPSLPFVRREGLKALQADYASQEAARGGIAQAVAAFYGESYPQVAAEKKDAVARAGAALGDIWCWNVFPQMKIGWGTYRNHIGHSADMSGQVGCFRCHDEEHKAADGTAISQDCTTCHSILAQDEKDPAILKTILGD
jgi:NapC/NirT cytochrome c family, N-terminal region